jgi:hypothetical protein
VDEDAAEEVIGAAADVIGSSVFLGDGGAPAPARRRAAALERGPVSRLHGGSGLGSGGGAVPPCATACGAGWGGGKVGWVSRVEGCQIWGLKLKFRGTCKIRAQELIFFVKISKIKFRIGIQFK